MKIILLLPMVLIACTNNQAKVKAVNHVGNNQKLAQKKLMTMQKNLKIF